MPAIGASEFVAKAEAKGFLFSLKPDGSLGVKPPAPDAMTDKVRQYVREQKAELVALIESRVGHCVSTAFNAPPAPAEAQVLNTEPLTIQPVEADLVAIERLPQAAPPADAVPSADDWQARFDGGRIGEPPGGWVGLLDRGEALPVAQANTSVGVTTRTFAPPVRTEERVRWERCMDAAASGKWRIYWPTTAPDGSLYAPVEVSPGVTIAANPREWFVTNWGRYCDLWHKVYGETGQAFWQESSARWYRALEALETLYTDLLNVLDQAIELPTEAADPPPPVEAGRAAYDEWVVRAMERQHLAPEPLPDLSSSLVTELKRLSEDTTPWK